MISINDLMILPFAILFAWVGSFLWHELSHIKSQGIKMSGTIWVDAFGMTVLPDEMKWPQLFALAGGLYSGVVYLIMSGFLFYYEAWALYIAFSTFGAINVVYGFWEWLHGPEGRFKIYGITSILMAIFWSIYTVIYM